MKKTRSQKITKLIQSLAQAREEIKQLQSEAKEASEEIKHYMGDNHTLMAGDFIVMLSEKTRRSFDRQLLEEVLGDKIHEYEKEVRYNTLEVRGL